MMLVVMSLMNDSGDDDNNDTYADVNFVDKMEVDVNDDDCFDECIYWNLYINLCSVSLCVCYSCSPHQAYQP